VATATSASAQIEAFEEAELGSRFCSLGKTLLWQRFNFGYAGAVEQNRRSGGGV